MRGQTVILGDYCFYENGWDKEILWDVLATEGDRALLISRYGLDTIPFSTERDKTWDNCSLRRWLNNDFYHYAFSDAEKKAIIETPVLPDNNPDHDTYAGKPSKDKLFVLSKSEIDRYFTGKGDLRCTSTEYAKKRGAFTWDYNGCCLWWLRTPGDKSNRIIAVNAAGGCRSEGDYAQRDEVCVRPAMWVDFPLLGQQLPGFRMGTEEEEEPEWE